MEFSFKNISLTILFIYLAICSWLWCNQENILFNAYRLPSDYMFESTDAFKLKVAPSIFLNCLWIKDKSPKGVILYLHGNKRSINRSMPEAMNMTKLGYDILMVDYRGFGQSDGKIESEEQLYADVQKVYDYLLEDYAQNQIVIVGFSLGAVMASWLAAHNEPKALAMVSPFINSYDLKNRYFSWLIPDFLVKHPLNNLAHLKKVNCSTLFLHGKRDEVIPFASSQELVKINTTDFRLLLLEKETHRSVMRSLDFRKAIRDFLIDF